MPELYRQSGYIQGRNTVYNSVFSLAYVVSHAFRARIGSAWLLRRADMLRPLSVGALYMGKNKPRGHPFWRTFFNLLALRYRA